jgi:hypothetical protein
VSAVESRGPELSGARVTKEVVPRQDVVHAKALGAGEALADVALKERLVVDQRVVALAVDEPSFGHGLLAGLATARRFHGRLVDPGIPHRKALNIPHPRERGGATVSAGDPRL